MKFFNIFLIFIYFFSPLTEGSILSDTCSSMKGELLQEWTCPRSGKVRDGEFCQIKDTQNHPMIFNGCTFAFGNYGEVFFQACMYHDFCYHHEPTSHGLKKEDCDQKFLSDMLQTCKTQQPSDSDCQSEAMTMYRGVQYFGDSSWNCSKEFANYPKSSLFRVK